MADTQQAPAQTATPTPAAEQATPTYKFEGFKAYGLDETASEFFTEKLDGLKPEEKARVTGSKAEVGKFLRENLGQTIAKHKGFLVAEQKANEQLIAGQQKFLADLEPVAKDVFGDDAEELMTVLKEKAGTPNKEFGIYRKFAEKMISSRPGIEKRSAPQSTEKFTKAASATPDDQSSKKTFHLPTPDSKASPDDARVLSLLAAAMHS